MIPGLSHADEQSLSRTRTVSAEAPPGKTGSTSGGWGTLQWSMLMLEPPDRLIDSLLEDLPWQSDIRWHFSGTTDECGLLFRRAGLPPATLQRMLADGRLREIPRSGWQLQPDEEFLRTLSELARQTLYPRIELSSGLNPYPQPIALGAEPRKWQFADSTGLTAEVIDLVEQLSYRLDAGPNRFFSDIHFALAKLDSDGQRSRLLKVLLRQPTLLTRLSVDENQVRHLTSYWGGSGRNKAVLPLLQSIADNDDVDRIDLVHLLPPTPRKLLNTYPLLEMRIAGEQPDCFSTSFSFFSDEPPTRFYDSVRQTLAERYVKASEPWQFGDLILMRDPESDEVLHACNHLAGNLVFTKNGIDLLRPWTISRIDWVMDTYLHNGRLSASFYRLKPEFQR